MGDDDREWDRASAGPARARRRRSVRPLAVVVAVFLAAGGAVAAAVLVRSLASAGGWDSLPPVLTSPTAGDQELYADDDPWGPYLADERTCPGGEDITRSPQAQADIMVCLINFARARAGVPTLAVSGVLSTSARLKGEEIVRCGVFAHGPCGDDPGTGIRSLGYRGSFGENLYVADGRLAAPRVALDHWLNSPEHRENLFRPQWRVQSLYVLKIERFREYRNGELWVSHFGDR